MRHLKLYEEFNKEYTGYITGSLSYLYKHKKELEDQIAELDNKSSVQKMMTQNHPGGLDFKSYKSRMDMIHDWVYQKSELQLELGKVNDEIEKRTKSKLDESAGTKDKFVPDGIIYTGGFMKTSHNSWESTMFPEYDATITRFKGDDNFQLDVFDSNIEEGDEAHVYSDTYDTFQDACDYFQKNYVD